MNLQIFVVEDVHDAERTSDFAPTGSPFNIMDVDYVDLPDLVEYEGPGSPINVD